MDWQSILVFSLTFSISFHLVGRGLGFLEFKLRDRKLDQMLNRLLPIERSLNDYHLRRVK